MNTQTIRKQKWFWPWQDEEEEAWLRQMAQHGYHLASPGLLGLYTFIQGEKQDVIYRLDFITQKMRKDEYYQLFKDAGWEYVGEMSAWQYWRKPAAENQATTEIFTDNESKAQKYRRVLIFAAIFIPILAVNTRNLLLLPGNSFYSDFLHFAAFLNGLLLVIYIYVVTRISLRIRQLKQL